MVFGDSCLGAVYQVMSRGDRREPIFHDDPDREQFVATPGEACQKAAWEAHAFCLIPKVGRGRFLTLSHAHRWSSVTVAAPPRWLL
jgi:hypothetical protein